MNKANTEPTGRPILRCIFDKQMQILRLSNRLFYITEIFLCLYFIETFMTSNTNTKIQKIDNVHVTNRVWNNRNAVIKELPDFLKGAMLFQLPYKDIQRGTIFSITACEQSDVVIAHEDAKVNGRNGWSEDTLRIDGIRGWQPCPAPVLTIVSNNTPFCTLPKIWSRGLQKGQTMELPEVETSETVAAIFVVEGMKFLSEPLSM